MKNAAPSHFSSSGSFRTRFTVVLGLTLLGVVVVFSLYLREFVKCHQDVIIYAQVARNLAEGRGLTTNLRYVFEIPMTPMMDGALSWTYLRNLAQPFFLWLPIKLSGGSENAILLFSSFIFLLTLIPLYLITRHLADPLTGVVACVLCLLDVSIVRVGYQGFTQVPFLFLMLWCFYFLLRERENKGALAASALLLGVTSFFREDAHYILVAMVVYLFFNNQGRKRFWKPALLLGVFTLVSLPKSLYFIHYFGSTATPHIAYTLLNYLDSYPSWIIMSHLDIPSVAEVLKTYPLELLIRGARFLWRSLWLIPKLHAATMFLSLLGLVVVQRSKPQRDYAFFCIGIFVLFLAQYMLAIPQERYFQMPAAYFMPIAAIGIVEIIRESAGRGKREKRMIVLLVTVLVAWQAHRIIEPFYNTEMHKKNMAERQAFLIVHQKMKQTIPEETWVFSDKPQNIAWYVNRRVINLPLDMATLDRLENEYAVPHDSFILMSDWYTQRTGLYDKAYFESYTKHLPLAGREFAGSLRLEGQPKIKFFVPPGFSSVME